ncbi:glycosyltransferase family 2 protein, partial [Metapseudomonas otitidis]
YPTRSIYNQLCDLEWDTPVGQAKACGGDALMRADAFVQVNGYRADLIAGEEPELCVRLRAQGWKVWRLDAEMTLHDAAMT